MRLLQNIFRITYEGEERQCAKKVFLSKLQNILVVHHFVKIWVKYVVLSTLI